MKMNSRYWLFSAGFVAALILNIPLIGQTNTSREVQLHYERAQRALGEGRSETAAQEFQEILKLDPKKAEAHANLGVIAYQQRRYSEAAQAFSAALKLSPSLWDAKAFLGLAQLRLGEREQAQRLLEGSFRHIQNRELRLEAGMALIQMNQESNALDRAVEIISALEKASPENPDVLYLAYRTYSDLAAHAVSSLVQRAPDSARMHQILAQAAFLQNDVSGSVVEYRKALQANGEAAGLHYELGRTLLASSQEESVRDEAQKEFEAELARNPTNANAEYGLGEIDSLRSNWQRAADHYSRALAWQPDYADAHLALAKSLAYLDRGGEALPHLLAAARLDPDNEVVHHRLAQAYQKAGQTQEAEREMAVFRKLRNSHLPTHSLYGGGEQKSASHEGTEPNR